MSTFDDASLVFIPSGYKTSKAYSVKPSDGTGDLTFTRSNDTATRVGPDGLIEKVRTNLVTYSEAFTNVAWLKTNASVTADATTAPDGTTTADKIVATAISANHFVTMGSSVLNGEHTFSVFAKASEYSLFRIIDLFSNVYSTTFNLSNGTASGTGAAIQSVGSGWYRCSVTFTSSGSTVQNGFIGVPLSSINYAGDGVSGVFVWGAQFESGVMTDYIPTTSAAVSVGPVANVPRLDYLNSSCPRLILEGQRTNIVPNSEQFDSATWSNNGTLVANQGVSPDGYTNADLFYSTTGTGKRIFDAVTITSATTYTSSVFAKAAGKSFIYFPDIDNLTNSVWFNLSNGTFSTPIEGTAIMVDYGNGWYRCSLTTTSTSTTGYSYVGISDASGSTTFTQNGTDGVLIWGAQLEAGAYATSYIPTLGAAVTRGADAASKTGISSLIGQTEGTLFVEANANITGTAANFAGIAISDGTSSNSVAFGYYQDGRIQAAVFVGGSIVVNINLPSFGLTSGSHKFALAYKLNDYVFYVDGVQVGSDTSAAIPATSVLNLSDLVGGDISHNQALLFKTRLTNAQLAELTA